MFKIIQKWEDSLMWCPSQCKFKFKYNYINYEIYLRWRHTDPWTIDLIEQIEDGRQIWHDIKTPYFTSEDNLNTIKKHAFIEIMKWLKQHKNG